jgi:hypothetical protein
MAHCIKYWAIPYFTTSQTWGINCVSDPSVLTAFDSKHFIHVKTIYVEKYLPSKNKGTGFSPKQPSLIRTEA